MIINCFYYGQRGDFFGLEVLLTKETYEWEYNNYDSGDYADFVLDCLNKNYYSIALGYAPYMVRGSDSLEDKRHAHATAWIEKYPQDTFHAEFIEDCLITPKRVSMVHDDLEKLDIDNYREAVERIYISKDFPELTPLQKYYAYIRSGKQWRQSNTFSADIHMEYMDFGPDMKNPSEYPDEGYFGSKLQALPYNENWYSTICKLISEEKELVDVTVVPTYKFHSFRDAFIFLFHELIRDEHTIKKCENCGRYFVSSRNGAKYCDMPSPESPAKSCNEYMKYKKYLEKSHTEAARLHKQIYNQKANKVKRTGNVILKADLERFMEHSEQWRVSIRDGEKFEEDYIKWLRDVKENGL